MRNLIWQSALRKTSKSLRFALLLLLGSLLLLGLGYRETRPGHGDFLLSMFSGDWVTAIGSTTYEIGNMPDGSGHCVICRVGNNTSKRSRQGPEYREILRDIERYTFRGKWLIAETIGAYAWINLESGKVEKARTLAEVEAQAPAEITEMLDHLKKPRRSYRYPFLLAGGVMAMGTMVAFGSHVAQLKGRKRPAIGSQGRSSRIW